MNLKDLSPTETRQILLYLITDIDELYIMGILLVIQVF